MIQFLLIVMQRVKARRKAAEPRSEMVDNIVMALEVWVDSHTFKVLRCLPIPEI